MLFSCFPLTVELRGAQKQMFYKERAISPYPKRFLEFLYLAKISYREGIMNHELGATKPLGASHFCPPSCPLLPTPVPASFPLGSVENPTGLLSIEVSWLPKNPFTLYGAKL